MKKTLIAFALMVSGSAIAQTNYKTCMNPCKQKRDSIKKEINLHLNKAKTFEKIGNGLVITAIVSAILTYHLCDGKESIFVPLTIGTASLISFTIADRQEMKAEELKEKR